MTLQPLNDAYRPKVLDDIVGQPFPQKKLKGYVADFRAGKPNTPHLMFAGPPGTGKTSAAIAFCRELFGDGWKGCVLELNASNERGIDVVRGAIKDFAKTKPLGASFNIIYLDECDNLTNDAQGALRRTMEDYSKTCRFILSCNYPHKIIAPIHDRCTLLRFKPVDAKTMNETLRAIIKKEGGTYEDAATDLIVKASRGSMRSALNLLQAQLPEVTLEGVQAAVASSPGEEAYRGIMAKVLKGEVRSAEEDLISMLASGVSWEEMFARLFEVIDKSTLPEPTKNRVLYLLGEYEFRVTMGGSGELQLRCFVRHLASLKDGAK